MNIYFERLLLLRNATVNRNLGFDDVCKEKHVFVAYNNDLSKFLIMNGKMLEIPVRVYMLYGGVAWEWEVQAEFFASNNIKPVWLNGIFNWGRLNETTGQWDGTTGMIQRDEADYAMPGFAGTYARSKVADFSPGTYYAPFHWLTRYPLELPPTWNLLGLFTKGNISRMNETLI